MHKSEVQFHDGIPLDPAIRVFVPDESGAALLRQDGDQVEISGWALLHNDSSGWPVPVLLTSAVGVGGEDDEEDELVSWLYYEEDFIIGDGFGGYVLILPEAWSDHEVQQQKALAALAAELTS